MLDERMLENVGRCKRKYKNILVALLACSRNRNDISALAKGAISASFSTERLRCS
jgi:hypothetical protein